MQKPSTIYTAALASLYVALSLGTLALVVTATGPPITIWRVSTYVLLPVFVVWVSKRLGAIWAVVPLLAAVVIDRLISAGAIDGVDPWYYLGLMPYTALLTAVHLTMRLARTVQHRATVQH